MVLKQDKDYVPTVSDSEMSPHIDMETCLLERNLVGWETYKMRVNDSINILRMPVNVMYSSTFLTVYVLREGACYKYFFHG